MDVILTPELDQRVRERVARGDYESTDALVRQAVERLLAEDELDDAAADAVRSRIEAADREIDRGEFVEYDADSIRDLARDVHQRGLKRQRSG